MFAIKRCPEHQLKQRHNGWAPPLTGLCVSCMNKLCVYSYCAYAFCMTKKRKRIKWRPDFGMPQLPLGSCSFTPQTSLACILQKVTSCLQHQVQFTVTAFSLNREASPILKKYQWLYSTVWDTVSEGFLSEQTCCRMSCKAVRCFCRPSQSEPLAKLTLHDGTAVVRCTFGFLGN